MTAGSDTRDLLDAPRRTLDNRVRAGLDLARATAAIYVVFSHTVHLPGPAYWLSQFGQEAVLVFFLLSGFVIFANEQNRVERPGGYYLRRLRRIYPPMIVALAISTVLLWAGRIDAHFTWGSLGGTLLSLQDVDFLKPGVITGPYLGNDPLWSLSYEVFFYLVFPLVMLGWRRSESATRWGIAVVATLAYATFLAQPNHLSLVVAYFPMWWAGAIAAHLYLSDRMRLRAAIPELVALVAVTGVAGLGLMHYGFQGRVQFPFVVVRHAVVALAFFVALFITPLRHGAAMASLRVARGAALVAGISYGLYVVHYPLLVQTDAYKSWWFAPMLVVTIAAAWVADKWVPSLLPRAPRF